MKKPIKQVLKIRDLMATVLDESIVNAANIKDGQLFIQEVTEDGILLKPLDLSEQQQQKNEHVLQRARHPTKALQQDPSYHKNDIFGDDNPNGGKTC